MAFMDPPVRVAGYVNRWRSQRRSGGALFRGIEVDDKIGRIIDDYRTQSILLTRPS